MRRCALILFLCASCGDHTPIIPEDYAVTFTEGRNCRESVDHDLENVHIFANALALDPYVNRNGPFPVGAMLVKEHYDWDDPTCAGDILQWTVMEKLMDGASPEHGDWRWQRVDRERNVVTQDDGRCFACHVDCIEPDGYRTTCAVLP